MGEWFLNQFKGAGNAIGDFFISLSESIYQGLVYLMKEMVELITTFPLLRDIPELYVVWRFMLYLSLACLPIIVVVIGAKTVLSHDNVIHTVELKTVVSRLIYMGIFIIMSFPFIDWLIQFNNTLISTLTSKFDIIEALDYIGTSANFVGNIAAAGLVIYQMYLSIKIMIGYWLRVAEINLMAVVSPALFVLWINPNWGGHMGQWTRRVVTLIFTQFIQVILMVIYGMLTYKFFDTGTFSSICMAAATLILMDHTPSVLSSFIAPDNSFKIMQSTYRGIKGNVNKAHSVIKKFSTAKSKA